MSDPLAVAYSTPSYPYPTGYAQLGDVQARVGGWEPNLPTAFPSAAQVDAWLLEATANIDVALATRGYYVPLQPMAGWTPPTGVTLVQGIGVGAWLVLRHIAAAYATHFVEASRHAGAGHNEDQNAQAWMTIYDDFITRLETGADNLAAFGVGGAFAPDIDAAKGLDSGGLGAMLSDATLTEGPIFTKGMNLGGGWEQLPPPAPGRSW